MLRFFEKKVFGGCKSQIFFLETKMWGGETEWRRRRCSERHGGGFAGPGGHSASLEAQKSFLAGLKAPLPPLPRPE